MDPEIALSPFGQGVEKVAREVNDVSGINLLISKIQGTPREPRENMSSGEQVCCVCILEIRLAASTNRTRTYEYQNRKNDRNQV